MFRKTLFFFVLLNFLFCNSYSQHLKDNTWMIPFPKNPFILPVSIQNQSYPLNWNSRALGYNVSGSSVPHGFIKFNLNNPGAITSINTDSTSGTNYVSAACYDCNGIWWAVRINDKALIKIDTTTGNVQTIAYVTNANTVTGLAFDFKTNNMYLASNNGTSNKIGTLNLTTGVFSPLSGDVGTGVLIDIACSNSGVIYGHMITSQTTQSLIYTINKSTGVGTIIGQTGFIAQGMQGMSWDHDADSCYLAAYNYSTSMGELRKVNIQTGSTILIGNFNCEVDGFTIPVKPQPEISNFQILNYNTCTSPFIVNCIIRSIGSAVNPYLTKFFWSRNNAQITDSVPFTNTNGNNWSCTFPNNPPATYRYYIRIVDSIGRVGVLPAGAPANLFMFVNTYSDTSKPVITHNRIISFPYCSWPAMVQCQATEPCNIDSVWVSWKRNNSGAYYRFNLTHDTLNNWSGLFNTDSISVYQWDIIYYRIVARSASTQHTKDSTTLYNFSFNCANGNDTLQSNYPFTTYWEDGRTDLLFTLSELTCSSTPNFITQIAFHIINADPISMNGFNIRMQNTTMNNLTSFVNSGWWLCYSGTYTVQGTGWQNINLQNPFYRNANQNLLVEICYNNAAWSNYSKVYASPMTGKAVGYATDLPTGDGCTSAWTAAQLSYRPNVSFCGYIDEVKNSGINNIPLKYNLSQNYPNPFNPVTKIDYAIPKNGFVSLKIYDILGREEKILVNENKTPGLYSIDFNASDFPSGVYFYKLTCNDFIDVKRMILIK